MSLTSAPTQTQNVHTTKDVRALLLSQCLAHGQGPTQNICTCLFTLSSFSVEEQGCWCPLAKTLQLVLQKEPPPRQPPITRE